VREQTQLRPPDAHVSPIVGHDQKPSRTTTSGRCDSAGRLRDRGAVRRLRRLDHLLGGQRLPAAPLPVLPPLPCWWAAVRRRRLAPDSPELATCVRVVAADGSLGPSMSPHPIAVKQRSRRPRSPTSTTDHPTVS
jgi:hypothetical protein